MLLYILGPFQLIDLIHESLTDVFFFRIMIKHDSQNMWGGAIKNIFKIVFDIYIYIYIEKQQIM